MFTIIYQHYAVFSLLQGVHVGMFKNLKLYTGISYCYFQIQSSASTRKTGLDFINIFQG